MVLDSHVHFWKYDTGEDRRIDNTRKILQKNYLPVDIETTLKRNNVEGCIAVQSNQTELETRFLAELSHTHPVIRGVIGWTDLSASDTEKKLIDLKIYPSIVGICHNVRSEPDDFLYDKNFRKGISLLKNFDYTYDLFVLPKQLKAAADIAAAFPDQAFILDHCGSPAIINNEIEMWKKDIQKLSAHSNVSCKLSGLFTEAKWKDWRPADFYPYLDVVFEAFGPDRLLFGSNWPVILLSGMYVQWKSLLEKYMEHFLIEDKEKIFGLNAGRIYKI